MAKQPSMAFGPRAGADLGAPSDFGAPSAGPGPQAGAGPDSDPDDDGDSDGPTVSPEALNYHDDEHRCDGCEYYGGGNCQILKMPVQAEGACNSFKGTQDSDQGDMDDDASGGSQPPAAPARGPMQRGGYGS